MRTLRELFGRESAESIVDNPEAADNPTARVSARPWNTLSTLGVGDVADVDSRGVVYPRNRAVSVEVWFGAGDRWFRGGSADGVRQTRIVGLPIVETRQRVGDADIVLTTWADESGDGNGRVIINLANETDVAVVAAVVVRPFTILGQGSIDEIRTAENVIVVDRVPLVDVGRAPGDCVAASDVDVDSPAVLDRLALGGDSLVGETSFTDSTGRASMATLIPLTPGVDRQLQVLDGREQGAVAPAPLDLIVSGWRTHLRDAAEIDLPAWPKHIPTALMSSLLGHASGSRAPLGDDGWTLADDSILASALSGSGLHWAASVVAERLLDGVAEGIVPRAAWPQVAVACASIAGTESGDPVLARHGESVVALAGHTLSNARAIAAVQPLLRAVEAAHGADAARDASAITGSLTDAEAGVALARHGVPVPAESARNIDDVLDRATKPLDAEVIGLALAASASIDRPFEPLVPLRSLAGSTWRWPRGGCGDSPHARAALLVGLRSLCISEYPGGPAGAVVTVDTPVEISVFPGMNESWLGQNMRFALLPTAAGPLSVALRWHGERPALLWEFHGESTAAFSLISHQIDATFSTSERSGEALLLAPAHLVSAPKPQRSSLL